MVSGLLAYFPAALAGVARHSKLGNDKHNPGEPLHHARGKSSGHADCLVRHLVDMQDLMVNRDMQIDRNSLLLAEANALCWRALALSQELHENHDGAPLAPGARVPVNPAKPAGNAVVAEIVSEMFAQHYRPGVAA